VGVGGRVEGAEGAADGAAGVAAGLGRELGCGLGVVVVVVAVGAVVVVVETERGDGIGLGGAMAARGLMSVPARAGLAEGDGEVSGESDSSRPRGPRAIKMTSAVRRTAATTLATQATITLFLRSRKRRRECEVVWPPDVNPPGRTGSGTRMVESGGGDQA
jgi:hypothetical protein